MSDFPKKWRQPLTIAVLALFAVGLVHFAVLPLYRGIESKQTEIQEKLADQEMKSRKINELPRIKQQYEFIRSNEGGMGVLLREEEAVTLVQELEALAEKTGNAISIEIPDKSKAAKPAANSKNKEETSLADSLPSKEYLEMNIRLTGGYGEVVSFMHKLESSGYYSDIISFQIARAGAGAGKRTGGDMFSQDLKKEAGEKSDAEPAASDLDAVLVVAFYLDK